MSFEKIFQKKFQVQQIAHGRVNLLGEHTDYNSGLVLPMQINAKTELFASIHTDNERANTPAGNIRLYSQEIDDGIITRNTQDEKQGHWTDYVIGSLQVIEKSVKQHNQSFTLPSLDIYVTSDIPLGGGLSSSAALEIATLKLVRKLYTTDIAIGDNPLCQLPSDFDIAQAWNDEKLARLGQMAENEYVGLPCGLMDQLVISVGNTENATLIDFGNSDNPHYESVPLFDQVSFMVISSGYSHVLTDSNDKGYETRVQECQEGARILNVPHLSKITPEVLYEVIKHDEIRHVVANRVRHIVEENARVVKGANALKNKDHITFATCMNESHISQRDLYQVSILEIDHLVNTALQAGAIGARLTGGGFGGSIIIMVENNEKERIWKLISQEHPRATWLQ